MFTTGAGAFVPYQVAHFQDCSSQGEPADAERR
jgi:hypothetical protein